MEKFWVFYIKHVTNNFPVIGCYLSDSKDRNGRKEEIVDEIIKESDGCMQIHKSSSIRLLALSTTLVSSDAR